MVGRTSGPGAHAVVTVTVGDPNDVEVCASTLWDLGATAVVVDDAIAPARVSGDILGQPEVDPVIVLARFGVVHVALIDDERVAAANDQWREHAVPTRIGSRLVIRPAWVPLDAIERIPDQVVISIEPERCFGMGDHPSTVLALAAVIEATGARARRDESPEAAHGRMRVLDVGCGSGVLAVAAACLGAATVTAIDVDEAALRCTAANALRNGVSERIAASTSPLSQVMGHFDVVVANLGGAELPVRLAPDLCARVAHDGALIMSGMLASQVSAVRRAVEALGCVSDVRELDGWAAIVARRCEA